MSEHSVERRSISTHAAQRVLSAGVEVAREIGVPMSITVLDESGVLKAMVRMDGSPLMSVEVSRAKAYTAVATGFDTAGLFDYIAGEPSLLASLPEQPGMAIFGGGAPLADADGTLIGAVGVSGGHHTEDARVADAAAAIVGSPAGEDPGTSTS